MKKGHYMFNLPDSDILYCPNFIDADIANDLFLNLFNNIVWKQDDIKVFGKVYAQPRLTAFHGNGTKSYSYSNITMNPSPFTAELLAIKKNIDQLANIEFNACLLNLYRDGKDSNGWHSDDEKELGENPVIASVSLGQERAFHLRHKKNKALKHKIVLQHGSLLLMRGSTQHYWQHQIPKTTRIIKERINLTFRIMQ